MLIGSDTFILHRRTLDARVSRAHLRAFRADAPRERVHDVDLRRLVQQHEDVRAEHVTVREPARAQLDRVVRGVDGERRAVRARVDVPRDPRARL